ncbi:MAG: tolB protein precursor [Bacteroidota bacterium]|nr:tolB protein precursor [Bacteroidota bacterium]
MKCVLKASRVIFSVFLWLGVFHIQTTEAQYFGRNKPSYKAFNFKVYQTPHFEIYHYLKNDSVLNRLAQLSEQWYTLHASLFKDSIKKLNPIIFYNDQADFQQTTAIMGDIGIGTGGVTEALKNRVVLPIASSYAQTDHVLGHELVHAFQYNLLLSGDSGSLNNLRYLPLWMIEGMAEYFSIGSVDANTSMWMRDAVANNDFPSINEMTRSYKYFPYRYGQCFWAMVGKTWGDSLIIPIFRETIHSGYSQALKKVLGYDEYTLSGMWKNAMVNHYQRYLDQALTIPIGRKIIFAKTAGDMNISPAISPDGKHVIFFSEKDAFTFELYLADARTGRIIRKISSTIHNSEVDDFNYIESAGAWSPDGKKFAFTIFANGRNKLMIVNVDKGRTIGEYEIPGVPSFSNPTWNPVNDQIAVTGMVEGKNSLYIYNLKTGQVKQLTFDNYAYMQPSWSSDGKLLAFSTDKPLKSGASIDIKGGTNLGTINVETLETHLFYVFPGAKNLNPLFSPDNKSLFFLSNRDGFRNLYQYSPDSAKVQQLTSYFTGITGITEFSPALSVARKQDLLTYSYYYGGKYSIYSAAISDFKPVSVRADSVNFDAATLPPIKRAGSNIVDNHLLTRLDMPLAPKDSFKTVRFRPKFKLDYISNASVGVATSRFGTGMAGSVYAIFSDIVGQNQIFTSAAVNGEISTCGGQVAYLNSKHKFNWGLSLSHIPYIYGYYDNTDNRTDTIGMFYEKIFEEKLSLFVFRPLSQTRRLEFGLSSAWYWYRIDRWNYVYNTTYGWYLDNKEIRPHPSGFLAHNINGAYVIDNSVFGMTAPIRGKRARFGLEKNIGDLNFYTLTVDYRHYWYFKPYTIAFRGFHYGRYGKNAEDSRLTNMFLGYSWYVRGFDMANYENNPNFSLDDLSGSRMALTNLELRFPLTGPKNYAFIKSGFLYSDFSLFCDAGIAWTKNTYPTLKWKKDSSNERIPIVSVGPSLRINVLGYMVLEPFYAFPLQNGKFSKPVFGINFLPGW